MVSAAAGPDVRKPPTNEKSSVAETQAARRFIPHSNRVMSRTRNGPLSIRSIPRRFAKSAGCLPVARRRRRGVSPDAEQIRYKVADVTRRSLSAAASDGAARPPRGAAGGREPAADEPADRAGEEERGEEPRRRDDVGAARDRVERQERRHEARGPRARGRDRDEPGEHATLAPEHRAERDRALAASGDPGTDAPHERGDRESGEGDEPRAAEADRGEEQAEHEWADGQPEIARADVHAHPAPARRARAGRGDERGADRVVEGGAEPSREEREREDRERRREAERTGGEPRERDARPRHPARRAPAIGEVAEERLRE